MFLPNMEHDPLVVLYITNFKPRININGMKDHKIKINQYKKK